MIKLLKHPNFFVPIIALIIVGGLVIWRQPNDQPKQDTTAYSAGAKPVTNQPTDTKSTSFDKKQYSLTDPNSIWVIVNKDRPLPVGFAPTDLVTPNVPLRLGAGVEEMHVRQITATAMQEMFTAANAAGYKLLLASGYRSETAQKTLHDSYVAQKGAAAADTDSARAGYSEHQTGLAADVGRTDHECEVDACFADTPEGKWLADNSYKYGFIIRYQPGKQLVTGYVYEPWHVRYVGKDLAKAVHDSGQTLEEFFGLPAAPDYQ